MSANPRAKALPARLWRWTRFALKWALSLTAAVAAAFAILVAIPQAPLSIPRPVEHAVIRHVGVVDVVEGVVRPQMRVEFRAGKIVAVTPESDRAPAEGARVIDARGKFLIPGLWDTHVHHWFDVSAYLHSPLYLAHGVTQVRDMGSCANEDAPFMSCASTKREWSAAADKGEMIGPRIFSIGSFPIEIEGHANRGLAPYLTPSTPALAHDLLGRVGERRWDFVKVYNRVPRDVYFALMREANARGIEVSGHLPFAVGLDEAIAAGQRSLEHATVLPIACSDAGRTMRERGPGDKPIEILREAVTSPRNEQCQELLKAMAARGTWYVPTHVTRRFEAYADDPAFLEDERLRYIAWPWRIVWWLDARRMQRRVAEAGDPQLLRKFHQRGLALTGEAYRAGVPILAGTDAPDAYAFPGSGLHDELQELVRAGMLPADALRSATISPAKYAGRERVTGSIEAGKLADLVLLSDDPLRDIGNTRKIEMVVMGGRVYERAHLDRMLGFVEGKASSLAVFCRTTWRLLRSQEFRNLFDD